MDPRNPHTYRDTVERDPIAPAQDMPGAGTSIPGVLRDFHHGRPGDEPARAWCGRWSSFDFGQRGSESEFALWRIPRLQPVLWYRMRAFNADGTVRDGDLLVSGVHDYLTRVPYPLRNCHLLVFMRAGSHRAALGVPASEIAGRRVRAGDLWGREGRELEERLAVATADDERLRLMKAFLEQRHRRFASVAQAEIVRGMQYFLTHSLVADVASLSGWSTRHLQRLFLDHVGLAPKLVSRLLRVGDAVRNGLGSPRPDWARIALDHGFTDQAHFTRTSSELFGIAPGRLRRAMHDGGHWLDGLLILPGPPGEPATMDPTVTRSPFSVR